MHSLRRLFLGSKSSTCATFGLISIDHINIIFFQAPVTHTGRGAAELVIFSPLPSAARPIICLVYHCDFLPLYYLPQHTLQVTAEQGFCTAALQSLAELGRPLLRLKGKGPPISKPVAGLASENQTASQVHRRMLPLTASSRSGIKGSIPNHRGKDGFVHKCCQGKGSFWE